MTSKKGTVVVVAGPTASGKTDVSVELARRLGAPIISADSRQIFKGMAIGTAQPEPWQLEAVPHYFIADREITDDHNSGVFEKEALALLSELFRDYEYVIVTGGSGLYINALCNGLDDLPLANDKLRSDLANRMDDNGLADLLDELKRLDPVYYEQVDRNNPMRVMRALEVCITSGHPYSLLRSSTTAKRDFNIIKIAIATDRAELYERINLRVDRMMMAGLEEEARSLYAHRRLNALQTVGYKELFEYFDGNISRDEAVELLKRNTRRYAKRQLTWFGKDTDIRWFEKNDIESMENFIQKFAI